VLHHLFKYLCVIFDDNVSFLDNVPSIEFQKLALILVRLRLCKILTLQHMFVLLLTRTLTLLKIVA